MFEGLRRRWEIFGRFDLDQPPCIQRISLVAVSERFTLMGEKKRTNAVRGPVAAAVLLLAASCASQGPAPPLADAGLEARLAGAVDRPVARGHVQEGLRLLSAGDSSGAARAFGQALKLEPENPKLHVLGAIAYHLRYLQGGPADRDLAETGYLVALHLDPNNVAAATMLGQLYLESGRHRDAQRWLARSLLLGQPSARSYYALGVASYYSRDLPLALWAIRQAERSDPASPPILRAAALLNAVAGEDALSADRRRRYDVVEPDPALRRTLDDRMAQWRAALGEVRSDAFAAGRRAETIAQAATGPAASGVPAPSAPESPTGVPVAPNWSDCAPAAPSPGFGGGLLATGTADETVSLPALPSPCTGRPLPRMAIIDAVIVRSEDSRSTRKGVNLLDALSINLSGNLLDYQRLPETDSLGADSGGSRRDRTLRIALGASGAVIEYSLNIANATDLRSEVIARPSLLALDRQASTFFSGDVLTTTVVNQWGSGSAVDRPVGVSLSVTPTFIDDDSMLLSVKAARSFLSGAADLQKTVQMSRNVVSANVRIRFGETLALSGLSERENQENESGVPVLKDVPVVQYGFKQEDKLDFSKSILVLVTPRRPESAGSARAPGAAREGNEDVAQLRARAVAAMPATPNLEVVAANLDDNVLFRQFRSGDLKPQTWHRPEGFQRLMSEVADFLYY